MNIGEYMSGEEGTLRYVLGWGRNILSDEIDKAGQ